MRHGVWGVVTPKTLPRADGPPLSALRTASAKCTLVLPSQSRARLSGGGGAGPSTHPRQGTDLRRPTRPENQRTLKASVRDKPAEPATSGVD